MPVRRARGGAVRRMSFGRVLPRVTVEWKTGIFGPSQIELGICWEKALLRNGLQRSGVVPPQEMVSTVSVEPVWVCFRMEYEN